MSHLSQPAGTMPTPASDYPLRIGSPEDFAHVRALFARADYRDEPLCRALNISTVAKLNRIDWTKTPLDTLSPELRLCVQLLVRALPTSTNDIAAVWGAETLAAFQALGLLKQSRLRTGHLLPAVWLPPVDDFVVASDLPFDPEDDNFRVAGDVVFPASESVTLEFLQYLPDARNGDALDLCGGTGVGALHLARNARLAVTADVTPRSAYFAAFNGRLNDSPIESRCGDLYEPVSDQQFDLIVAHPPYVPEVGGHMIYRDGGDSGEDIIQRVIEGVPRHLRPGGTCVIVGFARDTSQQLFEQRAREWLGTAALEFDVIFAMNRTRSIEQIVDAQRRRLKDNVDSELKRLTQRLRDLDTRQFVHGALFLRRGATPVTAPPARVHVTSQACAADLERVLDWRARRRLPEFQDWLYTAQPSLSPHLELHTRHVVKDGQFTVAEIMFRIEREFNSALQPDAWIVPTISKLDGRHSVAEVFNAAHAAGELPQGFTLGAFAGFVDVMIERGYLQLDLPH